MPFLVYWIANQSKAIAEQRLGGGMAKNKKDTPKRQRITGKLRNFGRTPIRYNIGMRFLSFVILVALLSGGVVGLVIVKNSRDYLRQQAFQNNLNQANLAAAFASNYITAIEAHLEVFATRPDVRQAILNGTPEQLQPTLAELSKNPNGSR